MKKVIKKLRVLLRPYCWTITVWDTIKTGFFLDGILVEGHDWYQKKNGNLQCNRCAKVMKCNDL